MSANDQTMEDQPTVTNIDNEEQQAHTNETTSEQAGEEQAAQSTSDARIAELERQVEEHQQRYLRAQADFDNFRRRTAKEREELAQYATMKLITQLLPVVDNFERAVTAAKQNNDFEALSKGVDMVSRQFNQVLEQEGLKPMESVGEPFNPEYHQAVMQEQSADHEEGIVLEELQKGYMLKDKVLRPAMVKVSG
ncbi:molecular chaperone GrpE [Paenibacillus cellulosilyticus]|uniref:Protein GrpE n=1 Tax=Paenibacillus cellulosilyticus TaxID=375489 RepID=A0A2V2YPS7_9BACL|nr:nucleotide exchange factor GrpE [Paenibacillus cellulosilyticus]PWV98394.1 molecular chaperone GrpE [Paenibacillus cellulosilyticus]QKS43244.1 nucleotide exchange factor GrpE [Paenibacillus cellulosilyticus]